MSAGDGLRLRSSSRGAAFDDLDNDGDVDAVVLNIRESPSILRNDTHVKHHWISLRLVGTKTNRDAVGARVRIRAGEMQQWDEVHSGRGYQSHFGNRLYFGLGKHDKLDEIEVTWPDGTTSSHPAPLVDQLLTIKQPD